MVRILVTGQVPSTVALAIEPGRMADGWAGPSWRAGEGIKGIDAALGTGGQAGVSDRGVGKALKDAPASAGTCAAGL